MSSKYVFINDAFIESDKASVLIKDLSLQRGYGVFDFFKTINGIPIFLEDHLDRFYYSSAQMHLQIDHSRTALKKIIKELLSINNTLDSGVRMTLTGGYSEDGYNIAAQSNLIISQQLFSTDANITKEGLKLVTYNYQRQLSNIKTLDYLTAIWLQPFIKERGADDVLYFYNELISECPRSNFFLVNQDDQVLTSKNNMLKGVTRKNILDLNQNEITIVERDINLEDLAQAKEAFITSTTKNILHVSEINGRTLGTGQAGELTLKLSKLLQDRINRYMITADYLL